ncbi:MAG: peptidylprolyl isomerase [Peptostreptococcaceae bacterium]
MKKLKSGILAALILTLTVGCSSNNSAVSDDEVVALVNGTEISAGYYKKNLDLQKQALESIYGSDVWSQEIEEGMTFEKAIKDDILQQLINVEIIFSKVKERDLLPSDEEVNTMVDEINEVMEENEDYKKSLDEAGIDQEFIIRQETEKLALTNYETNFIENTVITDEDAKTYYDSNKDEFEIDEVDASHILISTMDDEGTSFDEEQKEEARAKAQGILDRINAGEDFAELAKEFSDDPGSGSLGGELGFFGKGEMVPEFEEASFELQVGEVSELVETYFGYHIIKVNDKNEGIVDFEEVKDELKEMLVQQKLSEEVEELIQNATIEKYEDVVDRIVI